MPDTKVIMPQMGESIFEGTLTKWLKKPGDKVERDEPLFEISTDKVDSEIPSPAAGILQQILVAEGKTVEINTVVAIIGDGSAVAPVKPTPAKSPDTAAPVTTGDVPHAAAPPAAPAGPAVSKEIHSSPLVKRIARENGIDLGALSGKGTGINGRVTKADILSHLEQGGASARTTPPPAAPSYAGEAERIPLTAIRKAIAERMVQSRRTSAHVTTFFEVDCAKIMAARAVLKDEFERNGAHLTVTPFFVEAAAKALKAFPIVNSSLEGDTIVYKKAIHIGIAVNLEWGLIVPVVRDADKRDLLALTRTINDLGERAKTRKLVPDEVKDGTFTITNPGTYGGLVGTPIINQPQVAILGMGGIKKRAVVVDDQIVIRPMIMLSLSFDHRVIDGAVADQFMANIQKQLEHWTN